MPGHQRGSSALLIVDRVHIGLHALDNLSVIVEYPVIGWITFFIAVHDHIVYLQLGLPDLLHTIEDGLLLAQLISGDSGRKFDVGQRPSWIFRLGIGDDFEDTHLLIKLICGSSETFDNRDPGVRRHYASIYAWNICDDRCNNNGEVFDYCLIALIVLYLYPTCIDADFEIELGRRYLMEDTQVVLEDIFDLLCQFWQIRAFKDTKI